MSQIIHKDVESWSIPSDLGVPKGKGPLFKEESPAQPMTVLQAWVDWVNLAGGGSDSICTLSCYGYGTYLGANDPVELYFSIVEDNLPVVYKPYTMFTGAAPSDGMKLVRIGNFNIQDGRMLKVYVDNVYFEVDATGTAYTAGTVVVAPIGWIEG